MSRPQPAQPGAICPYFTEAASVRGTAAGGKERERRAEGVRDALRTALWGPSGRPDPTPLSTSAGQPAAILEPSPGLPQGIVGATWLLPGPGDPPAVESGLQGRGPLSSPAATGICPEIKQLDGRVKNDLLLDKSTMPEVKDLSEALPETSMDPITGVGVVASRNRAPTGYDVSLDMVNHHYQTPAKSGAVADHTTTVQWRTFFSADICAGVQ
ncbi:hypothetical protein P7K49_001711 [Saguinus oedipus]|uniref:Uncharacterized protein n=1 Tax=Saguinus oedipus TaxID=9490 RepID=A0ABQ9WFQ6_SAGOE|nr:hypothetical protein P7K49_001711 [Saguinus oedipus]